MTTKTIDVEDAIKAINRFRKSHGHSMIEASRRAGVHQSPANRIMNGHCRRPGKNLLKLCMYANYPNEVDYRPDPSSNPVLMEALSAAWDGSDENALALAQVILGIAKIASRSGN